MTVMQQLYESRPEHNKAGLVQYEDLTINFASGEIRVSGVLLRLTPVERKLLLTITRSPETLHRYDDLQRILWGNAEPSRHIQLQNYICRLRRKLRMRGRCPIITEQGRGYRFSPLLNRQ